MTAPRPDRDPWLDAALRHAPDAGAAPPPALSAAILRAAHDAVALPAAPARPSLAARLGAFWDWLARPPVAGAFASLLLGAAIVAMWQGAEIDPRVTPPPAAPAAPAPGPEPVETAAMTDRLTRATDAAPAGQRLREAQPSIVARRDAAAPSAVARKAPAAADAAAPALPASPGVPVESAATPADVRRLSSGVTGLVTPTPTPPAPAQAALPAPAAAAPAALDAAPSPAGQGAAERAAAQGDAVPAGGSAERRGELASMMKQRPAPAESPATLLAALRTQPQRWAWQRGLAPRRPMDPAMLEWLGGLEAELRWEPAAAAPASAATLTLLRDGAVRGVLHLEPESARLLVVGGGGWQAPLAPARAAALRAALERIAP